MTGGYQRGSDNDDTCQSELQDALRAVDGNTHQQFASCQLVLVFIDFLVQVSRFLVIGLDFLNRVQSFLYLFGHFPFVQVVRSVLLVQFSFGEDDDGQGNGDHPKQSECKCPVVECHAYRNQQDAEQRRNELRYGMRKSVFQFRTIVHDGGSQVGQVLFSEEREREFP